jgi:hypothetical protein
MLATFVIALDSIYMRNARVQHYSNYLLIMDRIKGADRPQPQEVIGGADTRLDSAVLIPHGGVCGSAKVGCLFVGQEVQ